MGCQHPSHPAPSSPTECEREVEERAGGLAERASELGVICCHVANCIVYVYLGYDTHQN